MLNVREDLDVEKYRENIKSSIIKEYYGDGKVKSNDFNAVIEKLTSHNEVLTSAHNSDMVADLEPQIERYVPNTNDAKQNIDQRDVVSNKKSPKQITKISFQRDTLRSCDEQLNCNVLNDDNSSVWYSVQEPITDTVDGLYSKFSAKLGNKIDKSASKNVSTQTELYTKSYFKTEQEHDQANVEKQNDENARNTWEKIEQLPEYESYELSSDDTRHYLNQRAHNCGKINLSSPSLYFDYTSGYSHQSDLFENMFGDSLLDGDGDGYCVEVYFEEDQVQLHKIELSFTKISLLGANKVEVEYPDDDDELFQNSAGDKDKVFRDRRISVPV